MLISALAELYAYVENVRARRKAEALLNVTRHLRVGEDTISTTLEIRTKFGARKEDINDPSSWPEQRYQILLSNFSLNNLELRHPKLWRLGFKPSAVEVRLRYRNEKLTFFSYSIYTLGHTSSGDPEELIAETIVGEGAGADPHSNFSVGYDIRPSFMIAHGRQLRFGAVLTSKATLDERDAGLNFDLSCISSISGCQAICELVPSVWREAVRRYKNKEMSLPDQLLENPRCPKY